MQYLRTQWARSLYIYIYIINRLSLRDGFLQTDLHSKPTDTHSYLHHSSCHPRHVAKTYHSANSSVCAVFVPTPTPSVPGVVRRRSSSAAEDTERRTSKELNVERRICPAKWRLPTRTTRWTSYIHVCKVKVKVTKKMAYRCRKFNAYCLLSCREHAKLIFLFWRPTASRSRSSIRAWAL